MKIISKYKDYYDYLGGIYGRDDTLTYDRRKTEEFPYHKLEKWYHTDVQPKYYEFYICNKIYTVFEYKKRLYHSGTDIIKLNAKLDKEGKHRHTIDLHGWIVPKDEKKRAKAFYDQYNNLSTDINLKHRRPILLNKNNYYSFRLKKQNFYIPDLKSFSFHKHLKAEEIYQEIYAFISHLKDYPEIPNNQTDDEKRQSHGFDKRYSFRHRKDI